jgi:hypothetical protein
MKPIFTIHAGEYLVGSYIENTFKNCNVWVPSKDSGIDLLVTDKKNKKTISLQVKFSRDFLVSHMEEYFQRGLRSCSWWTLNRDKISKSPADFWIFVLHTFNQRNMHYVIIEPKELLKKMTKIHGNNKTIQSYLWVTSKNKCFETRGLKKEEQILIANHRYKSITRDFTKYLNCWSPLKRKLR